MKRWPIFDRAVAVTTIRRALMWSFALLALLVALAFGLACFALHTLAAEPGGWSHTLRIGTASHFIDRPLSVPALMRLATHPIALRLMNGRSLPSRFGTLEFQSDDEGRRLQVHCAPCLLPVPELSTTPLRIAEARWSLQRRWQDDWFGEIVLGSGAHAIRGDWQGQLSAKGLQLTVTLPPAPLADHYRLFAGQLPELRQAVIDGSASLQVDLSLPSRRWRLKPQLIGAQVSGLGTEALLGALPPAQCTAHHKIAGFGTWLPRAVIAAEDQRFHEHPGYDLTESALAWQQEGTASTLRGASTITQQLAKLIFVGDGRDPVRKLRELLYAIEMERTLGKARILDLYLAMAPWGQGQCGAQAAAWHYLGKPAAALKPVEAAWLASLLRNPDAQAERVAESGRIDEARVAAIVRDLRPIGLARQRAAIDSVPGWLPAGLLMTGMP